ncbi:MAG: carboxypeptidase-like regulatory domain-containing protein, partial [Paramuribaculum sp.]|nr:carboxypeptidase-like regulatory domain-containing protein [Paramuribaculum sp.]
MKKQTPSYMMGVPVAIALGLGLLQPDRLHAQTAENHQYAVSGEEKPLLVYNGVVTDSNGDQLPGVTVKVEGTDRITITDINGRFSINAPKGSKLLFSMVGLSAQTVILGNDRNLDIEMKESAHALDEVVVVGYGTQKKENLTGAVAGITAKELENRPITNLSQGLQGLIGNLNISASDGTPGRGFGFNVLGTTSINSSGPLVLV